MTKWSQWKKDFREEVELHLYWYYLLFLNTHFIWDEDADSKRKATKKDITFKDFIKEIPKIWSGNTNRLNPVRQGLNRIGYHEDPYYDCTVDSYGNITNGCNLLSIQTFEMFDNPFVLAQVHKNANRRI